jgi:hypothetical protein
VPGATPPSVRSEPEMEVKMELPTYQSLIEVNAEIARPKGIRSPIHFAADVSNIRDEVSMSYSR